MNFRLAAPEIVWIINNSSPKLLIFEAQYAAMIEQLRPQLKSVETYGFHCLVDRKKDMPLATAHCRRA